MTSPHKLPRRRDGILHHLGRAGDVGGNVLESTHEFSPRRLRKLVISVPLTDKHLETLRARFPNVNIARMHEDNDSELADADAAIAWRLSPEQVKQAAQLRWLHTGGAGVEWLLTMPELRERRLLITNNSGIHVPNMAEHLLAMMLAFARQLPLLVRHQTQRAWQADDVRTRVFELNEQSLLLVGLGDIAQALATRAAALGMEVIGVRRRPDQPVPAGVSEVVGIDRLGEVIGGADHVAITLPLTHRTRGLIDVPLLDQMKPSTYIYNVGRGETIDSTALIRALEEGRIAGAGLDVTDPEPLPAESPLWGMDNVIITAHTSGATPKYWDRGFHLIAENIRRYQTGEPLINEVDQAEGY